MAFLVIEKEDFKEKLQKRITLGDKLIEKTRNEKDFDVLDKELRDWSDYNLELLKQSFDIPENEYKKEYYDAGEYKGIITKDSDLIIIIREIVTRYNECLIRLLNKVEILRVFTPEKKIVKKDSNSKNEVFIVHGHDETAKTKTARFIERLGFKPIILHEQASGSKTVIEKIEAYSNVGFGIVLYTPCDVGAKKTKSPQLKNRARQNVVFEHGFLIGKIGRENVCALVKDEIETPNDISGVVYVKMDDEDAWHLKLAKELRNSGYEVDMNKL